MSTEKRATKRGQLPPLDAQAPDQRVSVREPIKPRTIPCPWFFRNWDQFALACALTLLLLCFSVYACFHYRNAHATVEIQRFTPRVVESQIDINKATWSEFAALPEIGEEKARTIVRDRETNGKFTSVYDLRRVPGIGPKIMDEALPHLYADPGAEMTAVNEETSPSAARL